MRAFLAIPLPDDLAAALAAWGAKVPSLRAQSAATIHLTMRFLGEVPEDLPVAEAVGPVARAHEPFPIALRGTGVFPDPRRARVYWVGLGEGCENARLLSLDLERAVQGLGLAPEPRPWNGHVTLGRFRTPCRLPGEFLDPDREFGRFQASELVLFRSTLSPRGALHEPLRRLSLGGGMKPPAS